MEIPSISPALPILVAVELQERLTFGFGSGASQLYSLLLSFTPSPNSSRRLAQRVRRRLWVCYKEKKTWRLLISFMRALIILT